MQKIKYYGARVGDKFSENWVKDPRMSENNDITTTKNYREAMVSDSKKEMENTISIFLEHNFIEVSVYEFSEEQSQKIMEYRKEGK